MKQEDKKLLLADLCARLPYGVMVKVVGTNNPPEKVLKVGIDLPNPYITTETWAMCYPLDVRPYLRPMSSMTEEEYEQYRKFSHYGAACYRDNDYKEMVATPSFEKMDFLNAHHFDYRGLIEKGLAIAITENNNPYKE